MIPHKGKKQLYRHSPKLDTRCKSEDAIIFLMNDATKSSTLSKGFNGSQVAFALTWSALLTFTLLIYRLLTLNDRSNIKAFLDLSSLQWPTFCALALCFIVLFIIFFFCFSKRMKIAEIIYRRRWWIALAILILLVAANISGTSITMLAHYLPNSQVEGLLLGTPRSIRSDEWGVQTLQMLSQFSDKDNILQLYSTVSRGGQTDMSVFYQAPMWDISQIFRPFQWGFLFLGPERGFSFWWNSRLIFLFMITLEMGMLLCKKDKGLALSLACLIAFGPAIQWWYGAGAIVDIIAWGEASLVLAWLFCTSHSFLHKLAYILSEIITLGSYVMTLYASWLIAFSYIFVALLIAMIIHLKKHELLTFKLKWDLALILAGAIILVGLITFMLTRSWDAVSALFQSAQGTKASAVGSPLNIERSMFYPFFLTLFYQDSRITPNPCEISGFYDFFPLGIILAIVMQIRKRKVDPVLIGLLCVCILLDLFFYLPIPYEPIRKVLLPFVNTNRLMPAVSFVNVLLLLRAVASLKQFAFKKKAIVSLIAASLLFAITITLLGSLSQPEYATPLIFLLCILFLAFGTASFLSAHRMYIVSFSIICAMYCGLLINPVQQGLSTLRENDLVSKIEHVVENDPHALWATGVQNGFVLPQVGMVAGAPMLNSVNIYPDPSTWNKIDPMNEYESIWNRYGFFDICLTDDPTSFELLSSVYVKVNLNYDDLDTLGIEYLITKDSEDLDAHVPDAKLIDVSGNYAIWQLHPQL